MTDDERRIISDFVTRVAGANAGAAAPSAGPWGGMGRGSVPQSTPPLPPVDREADALIGDLFTRYPEARYRLTQTAFVQEHALVQAQNRIQELEWQLENTQRQAQAAQQPRGMFGGMFGGGPQRPVPMTPQPQPIAPPAGYNAMQQAPQGAAGGGGFLRTAAMTAAGVAGGLVLGNMLMGAFSGGGAAHAATATGGGFGQEAVPTSGSPWSDPGAAAAAQGWGDAPAEPAASSWGGNDASGGYDDRQFGGDSGGDAGGGGYDDEV